ncbi:MAG: class I SAM-dependent methyltransferase [Candidatus Omnitrophica bacterium]|nr:class I SAM-dependent methyltransferase [Candidatus Omnitrophota bacterium]
MKIIGCPLCGSENQRLVVVIAGYRIVCCQSCQLHFVNPQPTSEEILSFYKTRQESYLTDYAKKEISKRRGARREVRRVLRLMKKSNISLLDIGCGCGFFLKEANLAGIKARGVDICQAEVEFACKHYQAKAEYANFLDNSYTPGEKFDVVTLFDVIEHLSNPLAGLVKCRSFLKENGYIIVGTPDLAEAWKLKDISRWVEWKPPEHLIYFSLSTLTNLAEKSGFCYRGSFWTVPWRKRIKAVFQVVNGSG